jgi:hypothetical protein
MTSEPLASVVMDIGEDRIAMVDLADELQVRKQRIFKILPRLGIRPTPSSGLGGSHETDGSKAGADRHHVEGFAEAIEMAGTDRNAAPGNQGLSPSRRRPPNSLLKLVPPG